MADASLMTKERRAYIREEAVLARDARAAIPDDEFLTAAAEEAASYEQSLSAICGPDEIIAMIDTADALATALRKVSAKCGPAWCALRMCDRNDDCRLRVLLQRVD